MGKKHDCLLICSLDSLCGYLYSLNIFYFTFGPVRPVNRNAYEIVQRS